MKQCISFIIGLFCSVFYSQNINIEIFASGFNSPVNIKNAGDERLFVVEQDGSIQIINPDGTRNSIPFLNINSKVINGGGERGLLGLAFHPNYQSNGFFYLNYINNNGNTVISRYSRNTLDNDLADESSELQLLTYTQPYANHNGGDMAFGADGFLYISSGDGGNGGDPGDRAQSLTTLLGKLLRIDVDHTDDNTFYAIPNDNPFAGDMNARQEIWAYGLRNPWKFSFDKITNDLWLADVGQNQFEEINMMPSTISGVNYGWRCYEGNTVFNQSGNCPEDSALTFPIGVYSHSNSGLPKCSITGGYRYRGTKQPTLIGLYFFADYCSNEIGFLKQTDSNWNMSFTQPFTGNGWSTFGEDIHGELYIGGINSGTIFKINDSNLSINKHKVLSFQIIPNPTEKQVTLIFTNSITPIHNVQIFNVQGTLIISLANLGPSPITFSTENLSGGLYFVKVTNTLGDSVMKKLIKS